MQYEKIYTGDTFVVNHTEKVSPAGKVRRAVYHFHGTGLRFLRFGLNMPSDPVYFGLLCAGEKRKISSNSLMMFKLDGAAERYLLLGFSSYDYSDGTIILEEDPAGGFTATVWADYDHLLLPPGGRVGTDPTVELAGDDYNALLQEWAEIVSSHTGKRIPEKIPTGWNDWQYYRNEKTQEDILENCDALVRLREQGWECDFIQIDGGYCMHLSEWSVPTEKFSMGLKAVSEYVRSKGFRFGIWFAPYIQNIRTKVFQEHPDWFLKDVRGDLVILKQSNVGASALLDYTVEGTLDWLREKIRFLQDEWHAEWIKLDGPNIETYRRGVLSDRSMTVQQMLRRSLAVIAEEAHDILVEGEGSMTAASGLVDLHRVQADNHPMWRIGDVSYAPSVYGKELLMSFLHHIWWCNHRENIVLRDFQSPYSFMRQKDPPQDETLFTEDECRTQLASAMIAPSGLLLTDPVKKLLERPDLLEKVKMLYPVPAGKTFVLDPFPEDGSAYASLYKLQSDTRILYSVINWDDKEKEFFLPDPGTGYYRSLFDNKICSSQIRLAPHGADVLEYFE